MVLKIGLIDVDGHNWPNLCLMKLSAYHKRRGDQVDWWNGFEEYDKVYMSKVFTDEYSPDAAEPWNTMELVKGGTGYGLANRLPQEVEHIYPDYSLYPKQTEGTAFGFLTRGCPRDCAFCIVSEKEGRCSRKVANLPEFWDGQKNIKLLDPNILAAKESTGLLTQLSESGAWVDFTQGLDARLLTEENTVLLQSIKTKIIHFAWDNDECSGLITKNLKMFKEITGIDRRKAAVYVLTNFDTCHEFDLYRVNTLRNLGFDPYVMVYNKHSAPSQTRKLQRWVNNKVIWTTCGTFDEYDARIG